MKLSSQRAPANTMTNKTTKISPEGSHPHENRVHLGHSTEPSMTNQHVRNGCLFILCSICQL